MAEITEAARTRIAKLVKNWNWPDPAILEDILALGEEAVPALAELLTPELLAAARIDDAANTLVYYCVALLGETKDAAAIPVLAGLYSHLTEDDGLIETLSDTLFLLGPSAIGPLLKVVADDSLPYYPRMQAGAKAVNLAGRDLLRRAQIAAVLRPLLSDYMARPGTLSEDERMMIAILVSNLAEIADIPARPLIEAAFDAGRVGGDLHFGNGLPDMPYTTREDVAELFRQGGNEIFRPPEPFLERYREDRRKHLAAPPPPAAEPQTAIFTPRLGRNDPCWCGSGKKYKKCHLAQDEKEKSRL